MDEDPKQNKLNDEDAIYRVPDSHNEEDAERLDELTRVVKEESKKMGFFDRLVNLFISPGELFQNLIKFPVILAPYFLCVFISLIQIPGMMAYTEITTQALSNYSMERFGVDLTAAGLSATDDFPDDFNIDALINMGMYIGFAFSAFITPLIMALITAAGLFLLSKIFRGQATFMQMFSMCMHILVITMIGMALLIYLAPITNSMFMPTSLAAIFMPHASMDNVLALFLGSIEIFSIWGLILTFIGVKRINDFSSGKTAAVVGVYWVVSIAIAIIAGLAVIWGLNLTAGALGL